MYKVYVKVDEQKHVIAINSDVFLSNLDNWILIDEGDGDHFHHAQGNYLEKPLFTNEGTPRYKFENNKIVDRDEKEIKEDTPSLIVSPSNEERIAALEQTILEQDSALMELAKMIASIIGG